MKRFVLALTSIIISQILPLLGKPELILANKNIIIMLANAAVWLTQPPVSGSETKQNKNTDKFSVLLILFFSLGSIIIAVADWAYFSNVQSKTTLIAGIILILLGIAFRVWAIQTLGRYFTATVQIQQDHKLITKGPYKVVRHPSYLGAWATIVGTTVFFNSYIAFVIAFIGMGTSYYIRMKLEEKALIEMFGEQYIQYQQRVKQIIPFIW